MIYLDITSMFVGGIIGIITMIFWNWFYNRHKRFQNLAKELKEAHYNLKKADDVIRRLHYVISNA